MDPYAPPPGRSWFPRLLFIGSAALAALSFRSAWEQPAVGVLLLAVIFSLVMQRWLARRRVQTLLKSGDVDSVLARWSESLERVPHAETMGPLMTATALAAHGWLERAREVLSTAQRGPAWDAALEHRLFLDTLLLTFEGETRRALEQAGRLERLPLPTDEPFLIDRIRTLRQAVAALARAFSHEAVPGDQKLLVDASDASALVHWAMRYGAAIVAVDSRELKRAEELIAAAPVWPDESCFRLFHQEIDDELQRLASD